MLKSIGVLSVGNNQVHSGPKGGIIEKLTDPESEMVVKYPTQIYLP